MILPIFPLSLVAFPGAAQPLHIFEPAYRRLLIDCLKADRRFGINYVETKAPSGQAPAVDSVGCVMYVDSVDSLPDGRSNVITLGEVRYRVIETLDSDPYPRALTETFTDDVESAPSDEEVDRLRAGLRHVLELLRRIQDDQIRHIDVTVDAERLTFQASAALVVGPRIRQSLLELRDTSERARRLNLMIPTIEKDLLRRVRSHEGARQNGKGRR